MQTQFLIGVIITAGCLFGLRYDRWILQESGYGRWIRWLFGDVRGLWFLRAIMLLLALFGLLLAFNIVRPLRW